MEGTMHVEQEKHEIDYHIYSSYMSGVHIYFKNKTQIFISVLCYSC